MQGEQFDRRWIILAGFAVLAAVIVGIILISRSGGSDDNSSKTTASKENAGTEKKATEKGACKEVEQPEPREESLPKPKMTTKKG
jgi:hypothetical protein